MRGCVEAAITLHTFDSTESRAAANQPLQSNLGHDALLNTPNLTHLLPLSALQSMNANSSNVSSIDTRANSTAPQGEVSLTEGADNNSNRLTGTALNNGAQNGTTSHENPSKYSPNKELLSLPLDGRLSSPAAVCTTEAVLLFPPKSAKRGSFQITRVVTKSAEEDGETSPVDSDEVATIAGIDGRSSALIRSPSEGQNLIFEVSVNIQ